MYTLLLSVCFAEAFGFWPFHYFFAPSYENSDEFESFESFEEFHYHRPFHRILGHGY